MFGILPFLVQWMALSSIGNQLSRLRHPEKSYWTLLSDFQNLPENEIEKLLPQVCSLLVERDVTQDPDIFAYLEKILADKCAGCVTFGFRACSLLKAASQGPSEGIFRNVLSGGASNNAQTLREERIRYLSDLMESATMQGSHQLPPRVEYLRGIYFRDVVFVLDSLARLGIELKSYPVVQRNTNLRNAISQLNTLLFNRMLSTGQYGLQQLSSHIASSGSNSGMNTFGTTASSSSSSSSQDVRSAQQIAQNCPDAADYSIHLPLQHCDDKVLRILRFVTHECEVLPSKDRCPYVLVCEVLERPYTCKNDRLYAQPFIIQPAIQRPPPQQLLENMSHQQQQSQQQVQSPQFNYPPQQPQEPQLVPNNTFASSNINTGNTDTSSSTDMTNTASIHPLHTHSHIPAHYSPPPSFINDMPQPVYPHQQEQQQQQQQQSSSSSPNENVNNSNNNGKNENLNLFARHDITPPPPPSSSSVTSTTRSSNSDDRISGDITTSDESSIFNSNADRVKDIAASIEEKESLTSTSTSLNSKSGGDTTSSTSSSSTPLNVNSKSRRTLLKRRFSSSSSSSSSSPAEVRGGYDSNSSDSFDSNSVANSIDDNNNYYCSDDNSSNSGDSSDDDPMYAEYLRLQRLSSQQQSQSLPTDTLHHPSAAQSPLNIHQKTSKIVEPTLIQSSSLSSPLFTEPTTFDDSYSHSSHSTGNENNEQYPPQSSHSYQQHQHPLQPPSLPPQPHPHQTTDYTSTQQQQPQPSPIGMEHINNFESMNSNINTTPPPPLSPRPSAAVSYNSYSDSSSSSTQSIQSKCTFLRGKTYEEKRELVRATSVFGHLPGWNLKSFIVKSGDDLRKEMLAMQLIEYCQQVFRNEGLDILLRPYQIISTGSQTGLIEFLEGTKSIDRIKKSYISNMEDPTSTTATALLPTLKDYFEFIFGPSYTFVHSQAVSNFVRSLVGYSLVTYVLQVKDRHNANILVSADGTVIHIDFGFILGESPGFNINFENAPFKLTREYIDVLGGIDSAAFKTFEELFIKGFMALQKHIDGMYAIVQAFYGERRKGVADALRSRVLFANSHADIVGLIRDSLDSRRTKQYDWYQQKANNIVM